MRKLISSFTGALSRLGFGGKRKDGKRGNKLESRRLQLEFLESRELLSVAHAWGRAAGEHDDARDATAV